MEVKVGAGERDYFNGAIRKIETESSVLVSNSASFSFLKVL